MGFREVYGNTISENGWPMVDEGSCTWITVPGTDVSLEIQNGEPLRIMPAFAADIHAYVQPLRDADSACWTATNSVATSNHLSGTAMDLDWNDHPMGPEYAGWSQTQIATIRELLDFYEGTIFWGEDWDTPKDSMHFQMGYDTYQNPHTQDFINRKIRADGFSTFRRDSQPPPPLSPADQNALTIIQTGQVMGITPKGCQIGLATALVESSLLNYANSNVPESLNYPHDAVGSDHDSCGLFQQRSSTGWGSVADEMDPAKAAAMFFTALARLDYNSDANSPGWYAQHVQISAYPDRYDQRWNDAVNLYNRLINIAPPSGDDMAAVPQQQWDDLYNALCQPVESWSPFKALGEQPVWTRAQLITNADRFAHPEFIEWAASRGDQGALAALTAVANGDPAKYPDRAADIQLAQQVLARVKGGNTPAPAPAVVPAPVPAPAPAPTPAPAPGSNTIGPSGWVGIAGVVVQAALWLLHESTQLMSPQWASAASGLLALLTALGIYKVPNHTADADPVPTVAPSPPPPAPEPAPAPPSPPAPSSPGSISDVLAQTQRDIGELANKSEEMKRNLG